MSYPILQTIHAPADVRNLPQEKLLPLCNEIREFLIQNVSQTGGHLASNLGAVELTVALHRSMEPCDRIVFDVGHQCYTHKLLTGRMKDFSGLRHLNGISGFPNPKESPWDAFVAGHGSTSISVAVGMARAKKLRKEPGKVIAVIGDGAFTGGMVYEGMNNIGKLNNLIVILNDNKMSISKNVGQVAQYLTRLRTQPGYYQVKENMEKALDRLPIVGSPVKCILQTGKKFVRRQLYHSTFFEQMGFQYVGPVDGHDVQELSELFSNIRHQYGPVFVHLVTKKGKGYKPAEDNPGEFHGVSAFDPVRVPDPEMAPKESFSTQFGQTLVEAAKEDERICAITAAMKYGTGLHFFAHAFPERFFDVGMAEQHAVTFAGGLSSQGLLPVVSIYSTFYQRAYDQLIHDISLMKLNALFAVDRAGLVPGDGETHQGIYDAAFFSQIGFRTVTACNYAELKYWTRKLLAEGKGPRVIRFARGGENSLLAQLGCSGKEYDVISGNTSASTVLVGYGSIMAELIQAKEMLEQKGESVDIVHLVQISPLPEELIQTLLQYNTILFAEECVRVGSIGEQVSLRLCEHGWAGQFIHRSVDPAKATHATVDQLKLSLGMDPASIVSALSKKEEKH